MSNNNDSGAAGSDTIKQGAAGAYATVNGLKMYYEIHGSGTPLVLIHGGGSTIETNWGRVIGLLAKRHTVVAAEMQAHGRTPDREIPTSFEGDADDIAALLRQLKIGKADVFGFSNGASTTLQLAIRHPELVNKIVVASTFFKRAGAQPWFFGMMRDATFASLPQAYQDAFLKVNPDTAALRRMYERDVARMRTFQDVSDDLIRSIQAPALIISGDQDVNTPEHALEMHRLLAGSRLAVLPGGHGDYIGEITTPHRPEMVSATISMIEDFLGAPAETGK